MASGFETNAGNTQDTLLQDSIESMRGQLQEQLDSVQTSVGQATAYSAGDASHWAGAAPANLSAAIDRLAAVVFTLNSGTPIP